MDVKYEDIPQKELETIEQDGEKAEGVIKGEPPQKKEEPKLAKQPTTPAASKPETKITASKKV